VIGLQIAVKRGTRNVKGFAYIVDRVAGVIMHLFEQSNALGLFHGLRTSTFFASGSGCTQSSIGTFTNEISLKLSQCTEYVKD